MSETCEVDGCKRAKIGKLDKCEYHDDTLTNLLVNPTPLTDFLKE